MRIVGEKGKEIIIKRYIAKYIFKCNLVIAITNCILFNLQNIYVRFWQVSSIILANKRYFWKCNFPVNHNVCLSVCLSFCLSFCLSVCLSFCLLVCQSVCRSVCCSVCQSVCRFVCRSICRSFHKNEQFSVKFRLL